jgi:hypothetical protein
LKKIHFDAGWGSQEFSDLGMYGAHFTLVELSDRIELYTPGFLIVYRPAKDGISNLVRRIAQRTGKEIVVRPTPERIIPGMMWGVSIRLKRFVVPVLRLPLTSHFNIGNFLLPVELTDKKRRTMGVAGFSLTMK